MSSLNLDVTMSVLAELPSVTPSTFTNYSATARIQRPVSDFINIFVFRTDSIDVTDTVGSDTKFFFNLKTGEVLGTANVSLPNSRILESGAAGALALVHPNKINTTIATESSTNNASSNYVRYLAAELFGTHHGVDLFNNELTVRDDLNTLFNTAYLAKTNSISRAMADRDTDSISELFLKQLSSSETGRERLQDLTPYAVVADAGNGTDNNTPEVEAGIIEAAFDGTGKLYYLPFVAGDNISFLLTVKAAIDQHLLTGKTTAIEDRVFRILIELV